MRMLPNWTIRYNGLSKLPWLRDHFNAVNINHSYRSIYAVGAYQSFSTFASLAGDNTMGFITDATTGNLVPSSMFNVSTVSINESFSPLFGVDVTFLNNMTAKLEYRQTRALSLSMTSVQLNVLNLSMTSIQLNEAVSKDWVFGWGWRLDNFNLFGLGNSGRKTARGKAKNQRASQASQSRSQTGTNHGLNLRLDLSYRKQAAITRNIATVSSTASSGNTAFKLSFSAEYTLSKLMSMSFYLDRQTNTPLLASSSYPTTTQDFGLSIKFSLTR